MRNGSLPRATCPACDALKPLTPSGWCRSCRKTEWERAALPALLAEVFGPEKTRGPGLTALVHHLLHERNPRNVYRWLHELHPRVTHAIAQLAAGIEFDASMLREIRAVRGGAMFVDSLRRAGLLAPMSVEVYLDGVLARLITDLPRPRGLVLRAFFRFHLLQYAQLGRPGRRLDSEARALNVAQAFLAALDAGLDLADLTQSTIDRYVKKLAPSHHFFLHRFVHWLCTTNRCRRTLHVPYGPAAARAHAGEQALLTTLHRARTDADLAPDLRVFLLLLILCARGSSELCALRSAAIVRTSPTSIEVQFAKGDAVPIDGPEGELIASVAAASATWLFQSTQRPKHRTRAFMLTALRAAGIATPPRQLVSAALAMRCREIEAGEVRRSVGRRTLTGPFVEQTLSIAEREHIAAVMP
jgi:hypothetical protein